VLGSLEETREMELYTGGDEIQIQVTNRRQRFIFVRLHKLKLIRSTAVLADLVHFDRSVLRKKALNPIIS
jgi:hypothetical protein